jgi:hypothetical protein
MALGMAPVRLLLLAVEVTEAPLLLLLLLPMAVVVTVMGQASIAPTTTQVSTTNPRSI